MQASAPRFALNGTHDGPAPVANMPKKARVKAKPKPAIPKAAPGLKRFRMGMTVTLGVGIPLLSLAMSNLAGTLALAGQYALGGFALLLMLSVLGVSLSHLAWAIGDITKSPNAASWALAVALDLSLVLCELVGVYASGLGLVWVCTAVTAAVAMSSMAMNVYAFLMHPSSK